ncbi:MAG: Txe/YoeB family addiction module toxin [Lachnospiraceae bacterium]|nr:Txe/YoeB family addiction module toxin [Lachnospiraceae bacterium]
MSKITFAEVAWEESLYWQSQDKRTLKKINNLLKSIQREPYAGEGKPETLKDSPEGEWSRRINEKDRLVYIVNNENITITQCKGHYNDK